MRLTHNKPQSISYFIFGIHSSIAALDNPNRKIEKVCCTLNIFNIHKQLITKFNYEIVDVKTINRLLKAEHNHQGIIVKTNSLFQKNIKQIDFNKPNCKIVILDQITDPHNIGAIIRSAVAFGINYILLQFDNSPIENGLIAKAAAGTLEQITIINIVNIKNTLDLLKDNGFWVVGLDIAGKKFTNTLFGNKIVMILGSEDRGMRKLTKESCDLLIKISLKNDVESLNVSTAAAIFFYLSSL